MLASNASAFQCPGETPLTVAIASSPIIVLADVVAVKESAGKWGTEQSVDIRIQASWKGHLRDNDTIYAGGMRGPWFNLGERYLIFASIWQGHNHASLCMRTAEYSRAVEDVVKLGRPIWASSSIFVAVPEEASGLSVSIVPIKPIFDNVFDDVGFNITFHNGSKHEIRLPRRGAGPDGLVDIVIRRDKRWWTTLSGKKLEERPFDWSPLHPGENRTLSVIQSGRHIGQLGEHSAQAAIHFSTPTAGYWTGFVFSKSVNFKIVEYREKGE